MPVQNDPFTNPVLSAPVRSEKRVLLLLLGLTAFLAALALTIAYIVPLYGFERIHAGLPWIMGIGIGLIGALVLTALGMLMATIWLGREVPYSRKLRTIALKGLLPVLTVVGKLVGMKREAVQHAFVAVNNELVLSRCLNGNPPKRILLLTPHCLQDADCPVKVTHRVENCKRCGKCRIKGLLELSEKYGVDLAVATGGTIARRIVIEKRPDLIIAVACERDLTSGIQDTAPLPVYGVFNQRPFGPCLNTQVALEHLEAVLRQVTGRQVTSRQVTGLQVKDRQAADRQGEGRQGTEKGSQPGS